MNRLLIGLTFLVLFAGCRREHRAIDEHVLVASATLTSAWVRNFNPFSPNALWPTRAGIYEPLLIYNTLKGDFVPWLAKSYEWSEDHLNLEFEIREGVKWSDGETLDADDVIFTFRLLERDAGLDTASIWQRLSAVEKLNSYRVRFRLKVVDFPALPVIAHQMIVPEHVWSKVETPSHFVNPKPVGSGPYPTVSSFRTQLFELARHPDYWNTSAKLAKKLRMPAYQGNDTVSLALVSGQIDWAGHNLPLIERTYVARDPKHFKYWFPSLGGMVFLYANTKRGALAKKNVRIAISNAIDRERIVRIGMSGYTRPADGTALSPTYQKWKCCHEKAVQLTRYDPERGRALMRSSGCQLLDGIWHCDGAPMRLNLEVVSGWSDWVRTAQIIKEDLSRFGIVVNVKLYDYGAWSDHVQKGQFDLSIGWSVEGATPYEFYRGLASSTTVKPIGESSPTNWHRYGDTEFDELLRRFSAAPPGAERAALVKQMQHRFMAEFPAIPLFANPSWGTYSTRYFRGFPSEEKPYAKLTPHADPERLLVLTRIEPVVEAVPVAEEQNTNRGQP